MVDPAENQMSTADITRKKQRRIYVAKVRSTFTISNLTDVRLRNNATDSFAAMGFGTCFRCTSGAAVSNRGPGSDLANCILLDRAGSIFDGTYQQGCEWTATSCNPRRSFGVWLWICVVSG